MTDRFEKLTAENVPLLVVVKPYPSGAVVGLGVASDGCDLTPAEAIELGEQLLRAAEVAS